MSLQLDTVSAIVVGIAVGLVFGFIFTIRMYKNSVVGALTEIIEQANQGGEDDDSQCKMCPFNDDFDFEVGQPNTIEEYIKAMGYEPTDLEDEK